MTKEKCVTKFCRNPVALTYLGKPMCQTCYEKQCDKEDEIEEQRFKLADHDLTEEQKYIGRNEYFAQVN